MLPNAQLRTLPGAGFLMAYDDPVAVARELISFLGPGAAVPPWAKSPMRGNGDARCGAGAG